MGRDDRNIQIVVIDDHEFTTLGIARYLDGRDDLHVIATANDSRTARAALESHAGDVDVVVMDLSLGAEDGLELIRAFTTTWPRLRIVTHSMHDQRIYAEYALRAGARGYVMKSEDPIVLVQAIRKVHAGKIHLHPDVEARSTTRVTQGELYPEKAPFAGLSAREVTVLKLLGEGHSSREAAESLHLSFKTVQTYRERLKTKLGLRNANELIQYAVRFAREGETGPH